MNFQLWIIVKLFLKNKINFISPKSLWNSGAHYTCMHIILNKIQYRICWPAGVVQSPIIPRFRVWVLPLLARVEKWLNIAFLSGFIHYASTLFRSVISKRVYRDRDRHLMNLIEIAGKLFTDGLSLVTLWLVNAVQTSLLHAASLIEASESIRSEN
jgi:hypothetical protein